MSTVTVTVQLGTSQAYALAELCKRIDFFACRQHAVDPEEAYSMLAAMHQVREALAESGVTVR